MQITLNIEQIRADTPLPPLFRVRQCWQTTPVADVAATVWAELDRLGLAAHIRPGMQIAVTAGSRGITNIVQITAAAVAGCAIMGHYPLSYQQWVVTVAQQQKDRSRYLPHLGSLNKRLAVRSVPQWTWLNWVVLPMVRQFIWIGLLPKPMACW
jgi:hypothetical protein